MKTIQCKKCNGTGMVGTQINFMGENAMIHFDCSKCKGKGYIIKLETKKFLLYLVRWQCSTPVLALCLYILPFKTIINTILANLIGGCIFFWIDKRIFKKEEKNEIN